MQFTPWASGRHFSVCSEELTLEERFCGFLCVHSNFPSFHQSFHSLSGHECDFHLSVVSVTSLIGPVETPECGVAFAALWAPDFR